MYFLCGGVRIIGEAKICAMINTIITEPTQHGDMPIDIFTKLANDRVLFINNYVDDKVAMDICATLLLKDIEDSNKKISLYINAERGDIRSVFMIYDTINMLEAPVETICFGIVMDEITLLLASGAKGMRKAAANSIIGTGQLIHDKSYMSDLMGAKSQLDRFERDNKDFMNGIAKATGKKPSQIAKDFSRKQFLTAKQARKYGIIDEIITAKRK